MKFKRHISQLKEKLEKSESNLITLKDEVHNLRSELLTWFGRWQSLKTKKASLKTENKSLMSKNEEMLKHEEKNKTEIIKVKAKISEARRATRLQISS